MEGPFRRMITGEEAVPGSGVVCCQSSVPSAWEQGEEGLTRVGQAFDYVGCFCDAA